MHQDGRDYDTPIPSARLRPAVTQAFDMLGGDTKVALLEHLRRQGIDLTGKSQYTMGKISDALEQIFAKDATRLIMDIVWHYMKS